MSHKNKKIKKKLRQMIQAQMAAAEQAEQKQAFTPTALPKPVVKIERESEPKVAPKTETIEDKSKIKPTPEKNLTKLLNPYFSYDIKKIGITLSIIILVLVGAVAISHYTNWFNIVSERLFSAVHI